MSPRINLVLGLICSAIAISILAVRVPYYATIASISVILILAVWASLIIPTIRRRSRASE
ncbi:hypothetical protein [Rhizomonospora bruguierae]|uniref:hypothetical protein n=1 Tax=Rhizomonospora bruguierae TaxID=1581705 RepID=UPI001BCB3F85|nr:hypothetical protein [Micromonospora sp. NBRC 107566]